MIHSFTFDGINVVLDVGSGSLHVVDGLGLEAISMYERGFSLDQIESALAKKHNGVERFMEELVSLMAGNLLFATDLPPVPRTGPHIVKALCLHVAHDCNLNCRYCFAGQGSFSGQRSLMEPGTGFLAVDFLLTRSGNRKNIEIDFFGGEPLLNFPVIRDITAYAEREAAKRGKEIRFTLTTNGLLLQGDLARFFQEKGFNVVLSLDGRREVNDAMRPLPNGEGSFKRIFPKIRAFAAERNHENCVIRGTFTRNNMDFTRDVAFLRELGFKQISLEPVVGDEVEDYALRLADAPRLLEEYDRLTRYYLQEKEAGRPFSFFHFILDLQGGPCLQKRLKGCGAGSEYLAVTPEGHLFPCHQFVGEEDFKMGDLWGGGLSPALVEEFSGAHVHAKEGCSSCWARYHCGGGCHANAHKRRGSIRDVDELGCLLERKRLECALYLKAVEGLASMGGDGGGG